LKISDLKFKGHTQAGFWNLKSTKLKSSIGLMPLSVCIVCCNEEANIGRTLTSVFEVADEIILVDSGSNDRTLEIARSYGPKVKIFEESWKGFAPQKNSALEKAASDWVLSLDADESLSPELAEGIARVVGSVTDSGPAAYRFPRRNLVFGRWIRHGGYYPDPKVRLIRRGSAWFENRPVHEDLKVSGRIGSLRGDLVHHAYPTLANFIEHYNRYSSLGAKMVVARGPYGFSLLRVLIEPALGFFYDYVCRLGFLDGVPGLLLHLNHAAYVSWKYAKAWELTRQEQEKPADF
jgi:glycosyltransferase involved in cell wall biosynthesis